jgi:hypothetical protein
VAKQIDCIPWKPNWNNWHGDQWMGGKYAEVATIFDIGGYPEYLQYNYALDGPTGGGKTGTAVYICFNQGMVRGKRVFSNVPFSFFVQDNKGIWYKLVSLPFDLKKFVEGNEMYWDSYILIDEGNFTMDIRKMMSNMNLGMTDVLQEGRKMNVSVVFTTINANWLDPRFTGSLLDLRVSCKDLFFTPYGKAEGLRKGHVIHWDIYDITGKYSGYPGRPLGTRPFLMRQIFGAWQTRYFINPMDARRKLKFNSETITAGGSDEAGTGGIVDRQTMQDRIRLVTEGLQLSGTKTIPAKEIWATLGIESRGVAVWGGQLLKQMGYVKRQTDNGKGVRYYFYEIPKIVPAPAPVP